MDKDLFIVRIESKYCDYLRKYEPKVPYNYGSKELRPFVGVLFEVADKMYFAPLSSPKEKHLHLKNYIDLLKIDEGKLGVINFNNMIPVKEKSIIYIDLDIITKKTDEIKYYKLLKEQIFWLNRHKDKLYTRSKKLYDKYNNDTLPKNIKDRCCNYLLLEELCAKY